MARSGISSCPDEKTPGDESFPVATRLLSKAVRLQVLAFYRFARTADDVADNPAFSPEEKLLRLEILEQGLWGENSSPKSDTAQLLRRAVAEDHELLSHASHLLQAFRRDAVIDHCRDWSDLMAYCRFSAAPVGRFLLDLHKETASEAFHASDALCAALQITNHLQDCAEDFRTLNRVYLPRDWLIRAGLGHSALTEPATSPELRLVLDMVLDQVEGLIDLASVLPSHIADRRLRLEATATIAVVERLATLLRRSDPLAERVRLSPLQYGAAILVGLLRPRGRRR